MVTTLLPLPERPEGDNWFKSSFSEDSDACVQVRFVDGGVEVRDDKVTDGPVLTFTHAEWDAFLLGAFAGEFTLR
ncbi:DUF397 domain-containing protein [Kitasatospora sp. NPDC088134]|uniref:DUF397 domain-containing protein n=1 Tax=Kitasatospora sp. NPDC088134 TaxID=3364071 RepID=UPI003825FC81